MKYSDRQPTCPNCGYHQGITANYCPSCGQRNTNARLTLAAILLNAFEDVVDVDSRYLRSLRVLATMPGKLTQEYISGRRMHYVSPFRLFFSITVVLVFLLQSSWVTGSVNEEQDPNTYPPDELFISPSDSLLVLDWYRKFSDTTFSSQSISEIPPEQLAILHTKIPEQILDSAIAAAPKGYTSVAERIQHIDYESFQMGMFDEVYSIQGDAERIQTVVDSVLHDPGTSLGTKAGIRIMHNIHQHQDHVKELLRDNISFIVLAFIPLFALIVKLMYIRRPFLYIDHFIFTIHQHTFIALMALGYALWLMLPWSDLDLWSGRIALFLFLGSTYVYLLISMRTVYGQGWIKTWLKTALLQFLYLMFSSVFITLAFLTIALVA